MLQILAFTLLLATAGEPQTTPPAAEPPAVTAPATTENTAPTPPAQPEMVCHTVREEGTMGSNMVRRRRVCTPRPVAVAPTGTEPATPAPAVTEPAPAATTPPQTQPTG